MKQCCSESTIQLPGVAITARCAVQNHMATALGRMYFPCLFLPLGEMCLRDIFVLVSLFHWSIVQMTFPDAFTKNAACLP